MATLTDELETETAALGAVLQEIGAAAEVAIADAALEARRRGDRTMRLARAGTILTILGLGLVACGGRETRQAKEPPAGPAKDVRTVEIVRGGAVGEVAVPATVQSRKRAALSARMPASVTELPYQEGQWVEAGTVVVRLDDAALRAAVVAAEAGLRGGRVRSRAHEGAAREGRRHPARARADDRRRERRAGPAHRQRRTACPTPPCGRPSRGAWPYAWVNLGDVVNPGMPLIEDRGRGRPRTARDGRVRDRRDPASRIEGQGDGGRPARPADRHRHRRRPLRGPDHAPLRGEGGPARRRGPARRALRDACSSRAWPSTRG